MNKLHVIYDIYIHIYMILCYIIYAIWNYKIYSLHYAPKLKHHMLKRFSEKVTPIDLEKRGFNKYLLYT